MEATKQAQINMTPGDVGDVCAVPAGDGCDVQSSIDCPRGSIIGGCTRVSGKVELMELGSSVQPITELHVGVLPHLDPLIEQLTQLVGDMLEQRDELLSELETITPERQADHDGLIRQIGKLQLQLERAEPSLEQVREQADSRRTIDVTIHGLLHPNVVIVAKSRRYQIASEIEGPIQISCHPDGYLEYDAAGKSSRLSTMCKTETAESGQPTAALA